MAKEEAVNTNQPAAVDEAQVVTPVEDYEVQLAAKEAEIARLTEEGANWKVAALKAKSKQRAEEPNPYETEEEKFRRIAREELAESNLVRLNAEKDALIAKALKENKELKLANLNKSGVPASVGSHNESQPVRDTLVTQEQLAAFKARGWSDKDIERYKKNLIRYGR